jgi:thiamine phosphate synthase YjbQ (UPF0047 family)
MTWQTTLEIATAGRGTRDITDAVAEAVAASGLRCGLVLTCSCSTPAVR